MATKLPLPLSLFVFQEEQSIDRPRDIIIIILNHHHKIGQSESVQSTTGTDLANDYQSCAVDSIVSEIFRDHPASTFVFIVEHIFNCIACSDHISFSITASFSAI